jgi:hypothetical protein
MDILTIFYRNYLTNCSGVLENEIISDGNCFFHALEYADNTCDVEPLYRIIMYSRTRIYEQAINRLERKKKGGDTIIYDVDSLQNIPIQQQIDTYTINKDNKVWTTRDILYEAVVYKKKNIFMFGWNQVANTVGINIIQNNSDKDKDFNEDNTLFIINIFNQNDAYHYITFQRNSNTKLTPNKDFLRKLNNYRHTTEYTDSYDEIAIPQYGVIAYTIFMENFDPVLFSKKNKPITPDEQHNINMATTLSLSLQEQENSQKRKPPPKKSRSKIPSTGLSLNNAEPIEGHFSDNVARAITTKLRTLKLNRPMSQNALNAIGKILPKFQHRTQKLND